MSISISTVGITGNSINGSSHYDIFKMFEQNDETKLVMMSGEIGSSQEADTGVYATRTPSC